METFSNELREKNLKVTPQRLAVYSMLKGTKSHPNAETVFKTLAPDYPAMSFATVYKTLSAFKQCGLVQEILASEGGLRYDANTEPHPHLVCEKCNGIFDFYSNGVLSELKNQIEIEAQFDINSEQIYFFGVCRDCKNMM